MGEAELWVRERSNAKGSARSVMLALAGMAKGCIAISTTEKLAAEARISRRELFRALSELCQAGVIQKLAKQRDPKRLRAFHFAKLNCAKLGGVQHPLCPRKQSTVPDLKRGNGYCAKSLLPFSETVFAQEDCELCSGTGYRKIPRLDGSHGEVLVRCRHEIASIAGSWSRAPSWEDDWQHHRQADALRGLLEKPSGPAAKQELFDWNRAEAAWQMARQEEWLRQHPEVPTTPPEPTSALKKVIEIPKRKTA